MGSLLWRIALLASLFHAGSTLRLSAGCGEPLGGNFQPGQSARHTIQVDDPNLGVVTRTYRLHVPQQYNLNNDVPLPLVLDYHGWGSTAIAHEKVAKFTEIADNHDEEGFFVASPNGMGDNPNPGQWGSFNVSATIGPMGPSCDTDKAKYGETPCYSSCPNCDPTNSCDWTSCHDDVAFTRAILEDISAKLCVNLDSVHQTGWSNGAMFNYFSIAQLSGIFASIAPVAGTPMLGFGELPAVPTSLIDFHGINDDVIPYNLEHSPYGPGPYGTIMSPGGGYFYDKLTLIRTWYEGQGCTELGEAWPTPMDGVGEFSCTIWRGCKDGVEVVHCSGDYTHDYPFWPDYIEGTKIIWQFMKTHAKQ